MKTKVLLVEDEPAIREGLTDLLVFKGYDPTAVSDGAQGLKKLEEDIFPLMIFDVMLPEYSGFELCAFARKHHPQAGIILLTAKSQEEDIVRGFEEGCDDYITKPFSIKQFMLRLKALERRIEAPLAPSKLKLCTKTLRVLYDTKSVAVSKRDMEVLCFLHRNHDRIVAREELLKTVWGYKIARDVPTRCVDMHITKLRRKLKGLFQERELIRTVRGMGYRIELPQ